MIVQLAQREPSRRRWLVGAALTVAGLWVLAGPACGSGPAAELNELQTVGSGGTAGSSSISSGGPNTATTSTGTGTPGECNPGTIPEGVPEGWVEWTDCSGWRGEASTAAG